MWIDSNKLKSSNTSMLNLIMLLVGVINFEHESTDPADVMTKDFHLNMLNTQPYIQIEQRGS